MKTAIWNDVTEHAIEGITDVKTDYDMKLYEEHRKKMAGAIAMLHEFCDSAYYAKEAGETAFWAEAIKKAEAEYQRFTEGYYEHICNVLLGKKEEQE